MEYSILSMADIIRNNGTQCKCDELMNICGFQIKYMAYLSIIDS